MNPIRLVSGAVTLPAHAAAAVIGTTVGIATTGARTTVRVLGRALEQVSGSEAPARPWPGERSEPVESPAVTTPTSATAPAPAAPEAPAQATATKAPAKKAPAKKAAAKKAPARKAPAKKAPSAQAAVLAPALGLSEAEVEAELTDTADDITTPSGIPAAGEGFNPDTTDTDLHQPGTEPLMDPATVKSVASESEVLRRAADTDKG
ncbi:MAG TPA: hypothetical protein VFR45_09765 [Nocardioides sp.]|nr:hypothetical protein [Nocardioides sp.]